MEERSACGCAGVNFLRHSRTITTVYTVGGRAHQKQDDCFQTERSIIAMSLELGTGSGQAGKIKGKGIVVGIVVEGAKRTHHVPPAQNYESSVAVHPVNVAKYCSPLPNYHPVFTTNKHYESLLFLCLTLTPRPPRQTTFN